MLTTTLPIKNLQNNILVIIDSNPLPFFLFFSFLFFSFLFLSFWVRKSITIAIMLHNNFLLQSNYPNFKLTEKIKNLQKRKIQIWKIELNNYLM